MDTVAQFKNIQYYICEIYLEHEEWIRCKLQNYRQSNSVDQKETTESIIKLFTESYGLPSNHDIRQSLLCGYWHMTQTQYRSWSQIVECFLTLISHSNSATRINSDSDFTVDCASSSCSSLSDSNDSSMESSSLPHSVDSLNLMDTKFKLHCNSELHDNLNDIGRKVEKYMTLLENLLRGLDNISQITELMKEKYPTLDPENVDLQMRLRQQSMPNSEDTKEFLSLTSEICLDLEKVTDLVIQNVDKWKINQKLEYVKAGKCQGLPMLKTDCSANCRLLMKMIEIIGGDGFKCVIYGIKSYQQDLRFEHLRQSLIERLKNLFLSCFVVTVQPTDVQKVTGPGGPLKNQASKDKESTGRGRKNSTFNDKGEKPEEGQSRNSGLKMGPEFEVELQVLCGEGLDCISNVTKPVTAKFFYEANQIEGEPCAQLHISHASVDKHGVASFKRQKIKKFERPSKGSKNEQVTSERYRIVFETEITLSNPAINLKLKTMSLPLAIITGSNQANITHGALLWYCYNTDPYSLRSSPSSLPKQTVINMIQDCFSYLGGRQLRQDELDYLFDVVLECRSDEITFEEFVTKNYSSIKEHTFWKWLQSILNLIQYYLLQPWKDGMIYGFVSKDKSIELLKKEPAGTFLMRFSESIISGDGQNKNLTGAIVIALSLNSADRNPDKPRVTFTTPLTVGKYFAKNSMKDIICGVMDSNHKCLLKKVFGTRFTIKDIKERYAQRERTEDHNYPDWCERVFIELMADFKHLIVDDPDDEVESRATKRKVPRRSSSSQMKTKADVIPPNIQNTLPNPNIANQLLNNMSSSSTIDTLLVSQGNMAHIPSTVTEVLITEQIQEFLSTQASPMLSEQITTSQANTDFVQNFDENLQYAMYDPNTIASENSFSETYAGLTTNSTFSPESVMSMDSNYDSQTSAFLLLDHNSRISNTTLSPDSTYNPNYDQEL